MNFYIHRSDINNNCFQCHVVYDRLIGIITCTRTKKNSRVTNEMLTKDKDVN